MLNAKKGFTLSELLVSLAVLGLIAAFAVPKVLSSVGNSAFLANAKEAISTISNAFDAKKASLMNDTGGIVVSAINSRPVSSNMTCTANPAPATTFNFPGGAGTYATLAACNTALAATGASSSLIGNMLYAKIGAYTATGVGIPDTFTPAATLPAPAAGNAIQFNNGTIIAFHGLDTIGTEADAAVKGTLVFAVDGDGIGLAKPFNVVLAADGRIFVPAGAALTGPLATSYGLTLGGTASAPFAVNAATITALGNVVNS
ncbi:MAG: prepilin-type N-terminal cleavage/methylation domain-containing protein [Vampirovibrio sp.]|nr:prepilin-type N-terminal cleavage/methylation domain-containing protein [Vampirovibrio sp.]